MAVKNLVFKKCYLLAGVMMANIFVVNEVRASSDEEVISDEKSLLKINEKKKNNTNNKLSTVSGKILRWENSINFTVGSALSLANNYFKWWDYNKGGYWKWGCLGWRSGRFANGIFQFDINVNLGRGFSWLIPGLCKLIYVATGVSKNVYYCFYSSYLFFQIGSAKKRENAKIGFFIFSIAFCLQGFLSMPLVIHISTFDFTIALDSLIWGGVGFFSHLGDNTKKESILKNVELIEKPDNEQN